MNPLLANIYPGQLSAEQKLRLGTYGDTGQALWWSYYDSFLFDAAGANPLEQLFFTQPIGTAGKTLQDTNMRSGGSIPTGQHLRAEALEIYYAPSGTKTLAQYQDVIDMMATAVLILDISSKSNQIELPLIQMFGATAPLATSDASANPISRSDFQGVWQLPIPVVLAAQTTFSMRINWTAIPNASLDGDKLFLSFVGGLLTLQ